MSRSYLRQALTGALDCAFVALSVAIYGVVFGVLARGKGLEPLDVLAMSALVFSGTAQFIALDLWLPPLPIGALALTSLVVSLRFLLICASCRPLFARPDRWRAAFAMLLVTDENWAITMGRLARGARVGAAHMLGGGVLLWTVWVATTATGAALGGLVPDPASYGLDFAFTAAFLALLIGMWRGRGDLLTWAIAAVVATVASLLLPGKWYILIGGLAGSLAGSLARTSRRDG